MKVILLSIILLIATALNANLQYVVLLNVVAPQKA
jgi:hypothetical protein